MKGWLTMSSLFNKEDEDKLLPPEPCADQYVCVGGGWDGPGVPLLPCPLLLVYLSIFLTKEEGGGPAPGCFLFSHQERGQINLSGV